MRKTGGSVERGLERRAEHRPTGEAVLHELEMDPLLSQRLPELGGLLGIEPTEAHDDHLADARHIAQDSGVTLALDSSALEIPEPLATAASAFTMDARTWIFQGGEDHALLATFPPAATLPDGFVRIGRVEECGSDGAQVSVDGAVIRTAGGHQHFSG